jgi:WD40 repeat protein
MPLDFEFDVFISHSSKDKAVIRDLAERLRADGLRVWFDEWNIRPGDSIPAKIEDGLEQSRVLVLCMSAQAFGSDWAQLEAGTFRFRDPLNKGRRFIPLRMDEAPLKGSLAQLLYVNWQAENREKEYAKLLDACRPAEKKAEVTGVQVVPERAAEMAIRLETDVPIHTYAFDPTGKRALTGDDDKTMRLWDLKTGRCLRKFTDHSGAVNSVAWSTNQRRALSGSSDSTVRLWDVRTGHLLRVFEGHTHWIMSVAWSPHETRMLSGSDDDTIRLWDVESGRCLRVFDGHSDSVTSVAWSANQRHCLSASYDNTLRLWDTETGRCLRILEGHTDWVWSVAWSPRANVR